MRSKRKKHGESIPAIHPKQASGTGRRRKPTPRGRRYLPFPLVLNQLAGRLSATTDEIAAWVLMGPDDGGLCAYLNANEIDPPPRYSFGELDHARGFDYLGPLMECWFDAEELANFTPSERFITGHQLIERWGKRPGIQADAFIVAKIKESRLVDLHPIFGGTRATESHDAGLPPLEAGLFCLADVEAIEATDFRDATDKAGKIAGAAHSPGCSREWFRKQGQRGANARHDKPGGSRDKRRQLQETWASGKYTTRDTCAEQECGALGVTYPTARRWLRRSPEPKRT